jgi:putative SOS response-associated peptidase YedK
MCGRYSLATPNPADVRARFPIGETVEVRRRYNIAPGDEVLAVTTDREGRPRGEMLRWGLVPSWAASPDTGLKMINARVETVAERPAFRRAFERFRCLIIGDGFYEWRRVPTGPKQAFHITRGDGALFAFAGLWSI